MQFLGSRKSRKIFFIVNLAVQIISGTASFLFALITLAQFGQVGRVLRLELGLLCSALVELGRFYLVSLIDHYKIDLHVLKNKSASERTNFLVKLTVYLLKLTAAIVIVLLARFGGLDNMESIALSKEPTAIAYMVFVFLAIFLNMFTIFIAIVFRDYSAPVKGRKVRFITEIPRGEEQNGITYPLNFGRLSGMPDDCGRARAFLLGIDTPTEYCDGFVSALLVSKSGKEIWLVAPSDRAWTKKKIAEQLKFFDGDYKIKTSASAIEFHCFVSGNI